MSAPNPSSSRPFLHRYGNTVACVLIILIAVTAIVTAMQFPKTPIPTDIGAGAFPRVFALILIALCGIQIVAEILDVRSRPTATEEIRHEIEEETAPHGVQNYIRPALGVLGMVFYIALMPHLGYLLTTFCFLIAMIALMGFRNRLLNVVISAAITAVLYLLFKLGLQVPLPEGDLFYELEGFLIGIL